MIKILLVGCGYWGKNWYNTIKSSPYNLVGVVDPNPSIKVNVPLFKSLSDVDIEYTHAIVSTNANLHKDMVNFLNCPMKNILIEKPCGTDTDRQSLIDCFPGFLFLSSPQYKMMSEILDSDKLGDVIYSRFQRASMGPRIRTDVSIIEDYAIHDLYIYASLFGSANIDFIDGHVLRSFGNGIQPDTVFLNIKTKSHSASFFSSWRHYEKIRKIEICCEYGTILWNGDDIYLSTSHYKKIDGYDSYKNFGYELCHVEGKLSKKYPTIESKLVKSNLHLQLDDFINKVDRKNVFSDTNELISKIKGKIL